MLASLISISITLPVVKALADRANNAEVVTLYPRISTAGKVVALDIISNAPEIWLGPLEVRKIAPVT